MSKAKYIAITVNSVGALSNAGLTTSLGLKSNSASPIFTGTVTSPTFVGSLTGTSTGLSVTLAVASGGTGVTTSSGTGNNVLSTSPTLVTPILGTPSSGTVTNLTGTASININGTVGATTPNPGYFNLVNVGVGSGGVALSTNDGYGNANICFNHYNGSPDNTSVGAGLGSSARITAAVDSSTGSLSFSIGNTTSSGVAVGLTTVETMTTTGTTSYVNFTAPVLISNVATGTAPFVVTSTTAVANLSIGGNASNITAYTINQNLGTTNAVQHSDITTSRTASPTTGYSFFGNTGTNCIGFDGTNFVSSMPMSFNIAGSSTSCTGNAATATNVTGGVAGSVPYQTAAATTAMTAASSSAGQVLTTVTAGGAPTWVTPAVSLPSQTGNTGKYLKTDGSTASWTDTLTAVKLSAYQETVVSVTASTATTTLDMSLGSVFVVTISANTTFAFSNFPANTMLSSFTIITVNDATAGRAVTWPATVTWAGGLLPARTTTASKSDAWAFFTINAETKIVGSLSVASY